MIDAGANVIHVLTPPAAHAKVALAALNRGCHVLVEKPIAEDEADALAIGKVAKAKGLVASVNHSLLYDPQIKRALDLVQATLSRLAEIPEARRLEVSPNLKRDGLSAEIDLVVYGEFDDLAALDRYKAHPIYAQSTSIVRPRREIRIAVDFEATAD